MILAIGAAGRFGGYVVPALAKRGAKIRGFVHKLEDSDRARSHGAAEVAVGDLHDRKQFDAALKGVDSIFYIAPAFMPDEADLGRSVVDAAIRARVRRFVFSAVIHPVLSALSNHTAKAPVEDAILNSGMEYTFLHPARFYQNYAAFWPKVLKEGVLAEPWSSDSHFSLVDYRDVAETAAIALTDDRLLYGTFELCAPEHWNRKRVARLMSEVLGREIEEQRDMHVLSEVPHAERRMFDHYDQHDLLGNSLTLQAILEGEPRTLRAYFEELANNSSDRGA